MAIKEMRPLHANRHLRVVCIGAGASGIMLAYKLKQHFTDFTLHVFEKNSDVGGTWFENRYPGCRCDMPAHNYVYSFEGKPDWSASYAGAPEIYQYFSDFVEKYDLKQFIHCNREVHHAEWDEIASEWVVKVLNISSGFSREIRCDFLVNAGGILNNWKWPDIPGLNDFHGDLIHTAAWDDRLDVTGKRVGLIGSGSSGVQILPWLQENAAHVTAYIRSPGWIIPTHDGEYRDFSDDDIARFKADPAHHLATRKKVEQEWGGEFAVFHRESVAQQTIREQLSAEIRKTLNDDRLADKMVPQFAFGCRRGTPGPGYMEALVQPNVTVEFGGIRDVTPTSVISETGTVTELDVLICATGFDTTFRPRFPIVGRRGNLADFWKTEPRNYCSVAVSGYPNYFMFLGPNCTISNGPVLFAIEVEAEYMAKFFNRWQKEGVAYFDPKQDAQDDFMEHKNLFMETLSVWGDNCPSWYKDRVTKKVTAVWPGSHLHFMETLSTPRFDDYDIRYHNRNRFAYLGNGFSQIELNPHADIAYYVRSADPGDFVSRSTMSTFNAKDAGEKLHGKITLTV
ncbi:hypothetical protein BGW36DRAFT_418523 [Talaromyces proteolyticus]|uniref:FAD/NAD(P)-binding domain-containing protein n=1 Tax=Talaromyces proteolyticus TaxID=1131652 RepID=A0AAD4KMP5_9EURO|nr:uncharacterized protein BGW36DRAFT_418523 [Talaromyces proteolyticus]KAH8693845.1 hypothetical protein BGW36DRAFT_418523 [Talaromyces proteolyticus]